MGRAGTGGRVGGRSGGGVADRVARGRGWRGGARDRGGTGRPWEPVQAASGKVKCEDLEDVSNEMQIKSEKFGIAWALFIPVG